VNLPARPRMRRIVIDVSSIDLRRRRRVLAAETDPTLRASLTEQAIHRQMVRGELGRSEDDADERQSRPRR
jgi:hypothetical protein